MIVVFVVGGGVCFVGGGDVVIGVGIVSDDKVDSFDGIEDGCLDG